MSRLDDIWINTMEEYSKGDLTREQVALRFAETITPSVQLVDNNTAEEALEEVQPDNYEHCPHCHGCFSFSKPEDWLCPWCKQDIRDSSDHLNQKKRKSLYTEKDISTINSFIKDSGVVEMLEPWIRLKIALELLDK